MMGGLSSASGALDFEVEGQWKERGTDDDIEEAGFGIRHGVVGVSWAVVHCRLQ